MDTGYLLSFLAGMCIAVLEVVVCDIIFHKFFKRKRNNVHFYVARDKNGELFLYLGKPFRGTDRFHKYQSGCMIIDDINFSSFGLNKDDYTNIKWEDEPFEVFLNLEN